MKPMLESSLLYWIQMESLMVFHGEFMDVF